jgi:hypothetical protein
MGGAASLRLREGEGVMKGFEQAYERFMAKQIEESTGERRRRLIEVDRHGETLFAHHVWWPLFGSFEHLHAEWEVADLRRGFRYIDYAYLLPLRMAIEVEGFGVHAKNADRRKFTDEHIRAAHLQAEGWKVIRLSYDTVKDEPQVCRQVILNLIGKWSIVAGGAAQVQFTEEEKRLIRFAISKQASITPGEVCTFAGVSERTARRRLQEQVVRYCRESEPQVKISSQITDKRCS